MEGPTRAVMFLQTLLFATNVGIGICSSFGPWITNSGFPLPVQFFPNRLVYEQRENVTLECYGVKVLWGNVNISEGNYANSSENVKYVKNEATYPIRLTLFYNSAQWINRIQVTCYSSAAGQQSNFTSVIIEQIYPTSNVVINDGSGKVKAKPNQVVTLECKADGNPNASYGAWYNKTENGTYRIQDYGRSISFIYSNGTKFQYCCQARNFYRGRQKWINSSWVEVNSGPILHSSFFLAFFCLSLQSSWI